jgi:toxin ParE1/3/4
MTSCTVTSTAAAERDVRDIAAYIASDNPTAALRFAAEFAEALNRIGLFPDSGHPLPSFDRPILVIRVSRRFRKYLVFYRKLDATTVEVVRVLHSARDLSQLFAKTN